MKFYKSPVIMHIELKSDAFALAYHALILRSALPESQNHGVLSA